MYLYFLRHGEADWPNWKKSDDERPLTKRGKKEMHEVAKFLARIKARPALIVTSPLPRASQTAEIAAEHLKVKCQTDKLLAPGFGLNHLKRLFEKYPEKKFDGCRSRTKFHRHHFRFDWRDAQTLESGRRAGRCGSFFAKREVALATPAEDHEKVTRAIS
jgi:broad specificity phosphatase PhoE